MTDTPREPIRNISDSTNEHASYIPTTRYQQRPYAAARMYPGGLVAILGWAVVASGALLMLSVLSKLGEIPDLGLYDYMTAFGPSLMIIGIGTAAAALGSILLRMPDRF